VIRCTAFRHANSLRIIARENAWPERQKISRV
jgi:hypothetical protein